MWKAGWNKSVPSRAILKRSKNGLSGKRRRDAKLSALADAHSAMNSYWIWLKGCFILLYLSVETLAIAMIDGHVSFLHAKNINGETMAADRQL